MLGAIKSSIVRRIDAHAKSRARSTLFRLKLLRPRAVEQVVLDLCRSQDFKTFIQIGAHDGQYADPINLAVQLGSLKGLLVEPNPQYFTRLKSTYRNVGGLEFANVGVSDHAGILTLYSFDESDRTIPAWLLGSSSFDRDQVLRACRKAPGSTEKIVGMEIPVVSVDKLIEGSRFKDPNLVIVDAEGHDAVIVRQFLARAALPKAIIYEQDSMSTADRAEIADHLKQRGYVVRCLGQDSIAVRSDRA